VFSHPAWVSGERSVRFDSAPIRESEIVDFVMAITSLEVIIRHSIRDRDLSYRMLRLR
jgi:hypothetical protein